MPYYRCPGCTLVVYNAAGRFARDECPNCSEPLEDRDRVYIEARRPAAISRYFMPERGASAAARRELDTILWTLHSDEYYVLALLVSELINNSVKYSGVDPVGVVRLDVIATDQLVRVEVTDNGPGFEPELRTDDSPLDSHWGLHLLDELADRWQVVSGPGTMGSGHGTMVWFELDRALADESYAPAYG